MVIVPVSAGLSAKIRSMRTLGGAFEFVCVGDSGGASMLRPSGDRECGFISADGEDLGWDFD